MTRGHVTVPASKGLILLLLAAFAGFLPLTAQSGSYARPLKLRLLVPEPRNCIGAGKLKMDAVFSNDGDSPISVYTSTTYDFYFTRTIVRRNQLEVESHETRKDVGTRDSAMHDSPVILQPHVSIVVPLEYDTSDPFFGKSAAYSVSVRYMKNTETATPNEAVALGTESNEVLFEMSECH
jgi:hypothetical protein